MSAVLRASKIMRVSRAHPGVFARYHRGDPGFLDGLWNGIKGAATGFLAGGPIGAVLGGTQGLVSGASKGSTGAKIGGFTGGLLGKLTQAKSASMPGAGLVASQPMSMQLPTLPPLFPGDKPHHFGDPGNQTQSGTGVQDWDAGSRQGKAGMPCQSGYHWNKSGYYTKRYGYIEKQSVCVKNRKRNPLNPRAASRALARLSSTKKAMRGIERMMGKISGPRPVRMGTASSNGRRKRGCGCK